jgi:SAM-dependent methyltransferase
MNQSLQNVKTYYDEKIADKFIDFVEGNPRIERAWQTIEQWTPKNPQRLLEVGCGIGDICWRMTRRWPDVEVVGLDVSSKSLEIGQKLFGSSNLSFVEGPLVKGAITGKFDSIVLMDVYEHIAPTDRPALHEALRELRSAQGRIILSFPTPRHQAWLQQNYPDQIQPIDEDIDLSAIQNLANDTGTKILLYQEVDVWHEGDYAHAVLGKRDGWVVATTHPPFRGMRAWIRQLFQFRSSKTKPLKPLVPRKSQRRALIHQRLGSQYYPN